MERGTASNSSRLAVAATAVVATIEEEIVRVPSRLHHVDEDTMDVFSIRDYYKVLGYDNIVECWWLALGRPLKTGLRSLSHDSELLEMCFHAKNNQGIVHVYFEHGVSQPEFDDEEAQNQMLRLHTSITEPPPNASANAPTKSTTTNEAKPTTSKPKSSMLTTAKPTTSKPISFNHTTANPTTSKANQSKPTTTKHTISKPNLCQPTTIKQTQPKSQSSKPTTKKVTPNSNKPKAAKTTTVKFTPPVTSSSSNDSYESAEDSLYKPGAIESSSKIETDNGRFEVTKKNHKLKHAPGSAWSKGKQKMLLEEDMLVVNSDEEVDLVEVLGNKTVAEGGEYDTYDPYFADSDGNASWYYEEMKTPPNSKDEDTADDSDDVFPQFNEGARFGDYNLQVGMKFNTKQDFIEAATLKGATVIQRLTMKPSEAVAAAKAVVVANTGDAANVGADEHNGDTASNDGHDVANILKMMLGYDFPTHSKELNNNSCLHISVAELTHYLTISCSTVSIQPTRPKKLPPKRRSAQPSPAANIDPMQGASSGAAARLAGVMKFIPTPGFIPLRKK
ncbi:hypothetical protein Ahy_B10g105090 [Arachis hypogaea]|uniref:PB1-like domain-containing protein n=1 Tax=Arachis hypogaea TaxID=3818 RepID=A0A444X776_ARAHY|nr:hypothetical protein Ahy_B10g105090 [Arachis hypogaea]